MSTYSTNLRLELIGTGEQQGSWGNTTNTNLGTLLEQAIGGYEAITVSNVSDTTLTTANGSADQARNMTLNLTGTITATRNVICPAIEKVYIVKNATSGGFAVTFKVSGQTGVSIPNGATYVLYVDGVDVRQATGSVVSGGTGTTTSTGSGSVVLSTSPALTTPNLGTPSAATLTNATGLPLTTGVTGTLPVANGGTGVTTSTGSGANVLSTSPVLTTPNLGTPSAATLTNATGLPLTTGVTGTLPVTNGGTGVTTSTGTGANVLSASPALTGTPTSPTAANGTNTTQIATTAFVQTAVGSLGGVPSGSVSAYAGSSAPSGWLLCSGGAVSRATYAALFAIIGTTYGAGDGSTTFNLPDLRGRVAAGVDNMGGSAANRITAAGSGITGTTLGASGGSETHTLTEAQLAAHTHTYSNKIAATDSIYNSTGSTSAMQSLTTVSTATSSTGSNQAHNNTQPTIMLNYIIKT